MVTVNGRFVFVLIFPFSKKEEEDSSSHPKSTLLVDFVYITIHIWYYDMVDDPWSNDAMHYAAEFVYRHYMCE